MHLMPNRFSAVKMNMMAIATARPLPVSSPDGFTISGQIFASTYPTMAVAPTGTTAMACR